MKCDRCGKENYNESYYCRNCGAELDNPDKTIDRSSISTSNYLNRYQNNYKPYQSYNNHSNQTTKSDEVSTNKQYGNNNSSTDSNQYGYNNSSTDNNQYGYDNSATDNNQYGYDNTHTDSNQNWGNSFTDNEQYWGDNSSTDNKQSSYNNNSDYSKKAEDSNTSKDSKPFEYYSTPPANTKTNFNYENYLAHRQPSKFDTTRAKVLKINGVLSAIVAVVAVIVMILLEVLSMNYTPYFDRSSKASVQATEPATKPEDYTAKLSYEWYTIADSSGDHFEATFYIPEGYTYDPNSSASLALFSRDVYDNEVTLSASFFKGDLQEEIDYYSSLHGEDGATFNMEVLDTKLGEMTLITVNRADDTSVYHAYINSDETYRFHISLSDIPAKYKSEAYKLIDLIIEDTTIEPIDLDEKFKDVY